MSWAKLFTVVVFFLAINRSCQDPIKLDKVYDAVFAEIMQGYNKYVRPLYKVVPNLQTTEIIQTYDMELYFREYWQDARLAFDPDQFNNVSKIQLHEAHIDSLWTPDTFLPNAIKSNNPEHDSVTHRSLLRLQSSGHVLYSRRISVTAECPMDLAMYPFDYQICQLSIESYGFDTDHTVYRWRLKDPVSINENLELPEFKILKTWTISRNITLQTGTYSRLECCFKLRRSSASYFISTFFPAASVVTTSWIFIWMRRTCSWRDMIAVVLAETFLYFSYTQVMPSVSYIKVDIYLTICFVLVFFSLLKLSSMSRLASWIEKYEADPDFSVGKSSRIETVTCKSENSSDDNNKVTNLMVRMVKPVEQTAAFKVLAIFKALSVGVPLTFILFICSYFLAYIVLMDPTFNSECDF